MYLTIAEKSFDNKKNFIMTILLIQGEAEWTP